MILTLILTFVYHKIFHPFVPFPAELPIVVINIAANY